MKWLTRSIVPSMVAFAALIAFLPRSGPAIRLRAVDSRFVPARLTVPLDATILFVNDGKNTHTFTCPACGASSQDVQSGQAVALRFPKEGTFAFSCRYHQDQGMTGTIVVGHASPAAASPKASPSSSG